MKTSVSMLFSLPALFCSSVVAIPSPTFADRQQPLQAPQSSSSLSQWRTLSNHFIDAIFGISSESANSKQPHSSSVTSQVGRPPTSHTRAQYGGDLVLRFNISTSAEAATLAEAADTLLLDVWEFSHDWVDIRLAKDIVPSLLGLLPATLQTSHTPLMREQDLVQAIHNTYPSPHGHDQLPLPQRHHPATPATPPSPNRGFSPSLEQATGAETNIFFSDYQPLSVIEPWLRLLASLFTTHVRLVNIGSSYEGRRIPAVRVGVHPTNNEDPNPPKRKTILVIGGAHAREWIGTATVNYIAYSLITGYGKLQSVTKLLQDFDFVFIPTLNPDGYVYTWETDRLWRKNRQQTSVRFCHGIDLDHAFGFEWETSGNACSESYAGQSAFEAVEARRLADWARNETQNNNVEFVGFLDLHSYSQEILYPYSYSCGATPPGLENLEELAAGLSKAIRISHGHNYEILPACEGNVVPAAKKAKQQQQQSSSSSSAATEKAGKEHLRPRLEASGGSLLDYFYGVLDVRYAYQLKLRDRGTYGFLLPKENIVPTGKEVLNAVLYLAAFLSDMYSEAATEVQLTRPVWDDVDVSFAPTAGLDEEAGNEDVPGEDVQGEDDATANDLEEDQATPQILSAPTEDILDEVEEESVSDWMFAQAVPDTAHVEMDLKRRRRR